MAIVTSTEFRKQVGHFSGVAQHEPVIITERKRETLVVLSYEEYSRLKVMDTRRVSSPPAMPVEVRKGLQATESPDWASLYDAEMDA